MPQKADPFVGRALSYLAAAIPRPRGDLDNAVLLDPQNVQSGQPWARL
jgi:hypothetical protein